MNPPSPRNTPIQFIRQKLTQNVTVRVNFTGTRLVARHVPQTIYCKIDDGPEFPLEAGMVIDMGEGDWFKEVQLLNKDSSQALYVEVWACNKNVHYDPPFQKDAPTFIAGGEAGINGEDIYEIATLNPKRKQMRQLVVTNTDENNSVQIQLPDNTVLATVYPQSSWTIFTSDLLQVYNPNLSPITVQILATFYSYTW